MQTQLISAEKWRRSMPRKIDPKSCACGCGGETRGGDFMPGHDQRLRAAIEERVGGLLNLKRIVEESLGTTIGVDNDAQSMGDKVIAEVARYPSLSVKRNKGHRFPVRRNDWESGSLWVVPQPSMDQYAIKLNGDALVNLGGLVLMEFGASSHEDQGYPEWRIKENDMPRLIELAGKDRRS
jgi:hypothetical protein